jgi:hypothetical protein
MIQTNDANFMRDPTNNAVINTNVTAYSLYKQQRDSVRTIDSMGQEMDHLKSELSEIKQLLGQLIKNDNFNR